MDHVSAEFVAVALVCAVGEEERDNVSSLHPDRDLEGCPAF